MSEGGFSVAACAVITNDAGEVLLDRREDGDEWVLPGGSVEDAGSSDTLSPFKSAMRPALPTTTPVPSETAMPAASWPRCCRAYRPK